MRHEPGGRLERKEKFFGDADHQQRAGRQYSQSPGKDVAEELLADAGLSGKAVKYIYSEKYAKDVVTAQSVKRGTKVEENTVIEYTVSLGPEQKATPKPTKEQEYDYVGTITISANPFEYEDESALIKLILTQDGKSRTVYSGTLGYSDFPKRFEIKGWSENNGVITMSKGDDMLEGSYNIEFTRVAK